MFTHEQELQKEINRIFSFLQIIVDKDFDQTVAAEILIGEFGMQKSPEEQPIFTCPNCGTYVEEEGQYCSKLHEKGGCLPE